MTKRIAAVITSANIIEADEEPAFDLRLINWADWCNWGDDGSPKVPSTCVSAERQHQIPVWEGEEPRKRAPNERDAREIEDSMAALPAALRRTLRVHYVNYPNSWLRKDKPRSVETCDAIRASVMGLAVPAYLAQLQAGRNAVRKELNGRATAKSLAGGLRACG